MDPHRTRVLTHLHKLTGADGELMKLVDQADDLALEYRDFAKEVANDGDLSDAGREKKLEAKRVELRAKATQIHKQIEQPTSNLAAERAKVEPRGEALDPLLKDRVIRSFKELPPAERTNAALRLRGNPELAAALAEEPVFVTGIAPQTQEAARRIAWTSPDPDRLAKLDGQIAHTSEASDLVKTIIEKVEQ